MAKIRRDFQEANCPMDPRHLSTVPDADAIPVAAANHSDLVKSDGPIHSSYSINNMVTNMKGALLYFK